MAEVSAAPALALLEVLSPEQRRRLQVPWDSSERVRWTYLPGERAGLALRDMDEPQREAAYALLATGLSDRGLASARAVMELEAVLRDVESRAGRSGAQRRHPLHYWFAVHGEPGGPAPWGWRVGGHHVNVHVTVVDDQVVALPLFLGANPALAPDGSRTLGMEEDLGFEIVASLDDVQRPRVVLSDRAPDDIRTGDATRAELRAVPTGIGFGELRPDQQAQLGALVDWYAGRSPHLPLPRPEESTFAWLGGTGRGDPHYYAVRAGDFLVELDNTQDGANHVHTVVRDVRRDWGEDLLAAHYAARHG